MLERAACLITALCTPAFVLIALFSSEILTVWIDAQFAQSAAKILALMAGGMLVNSISFIPLTWLQANNHSKKVALIHLIELPLFCLLLWGGTHGVGQSGCGATLGVLGGTRAGDGAAGAHARCTPDVRGRVGVVRGRG